MFTDIIELRRKLFKLPNSNYPVSILPEYSVPFVIYLLAHNPSFSRINHKSLLTCRDCLLFYIEPLISKADNYLFLGKMFELIKQYVDAQSPDDLEINKNIYAVCDLASAILHEKVDKSTVGNFPGEVMLPTMLFTRRNKGAPTNTARYLPPDFNPFPGKVSGR
ncbi:PREDICTED: sister chromatid cohesion protein PDS5 homolog B-like, partial [Amphimedon queenslandica]|uniref:Uncharacterized protein n=1 Tax=Amphimedon queenslandica TaxID=400682 RepID=A0AAN0JKE3_AMPQE